MENAIEERISTFFCRQEKWKREMGGGKFLAMVRNRHKLKELFMLCVSTRNLIVIPA